MEILGFIRCCRILYGWSRPFQNLSFDGGPKVQPAARVTFGQFYALFHPRIGINRVNRGYKKQTNKKQKHQVPNRIKMQIMGFVTYQKDCGYSMLNF